MNQITAAINNTKAEFKLGILTLTLLKSEEAKHKALKITRFPEPIVRMRTVHSLKPLR